MTIKIYASELSPYGNRLRLAALLKNIEVDFELPPGGSGSAQVKQLSPFGRVPILIDDGKLLVESLALLEYLEDTQPGARKLLPDSAADRARVRAIALLFDHNVIKALGGVFAQVQSPQPDAALARAAFDEVTAELVKLVHYFDASGPAIGGRWSIADCAMAPFANLIDLLAPGFGAASPTQRVPRFTAWWAEASQLPEVASIKQTMHRGMMTMMAARKAAAAAAAG